MYWPFVHSLLSMSSFLFADAALAGLKILSVVDRKDRRMFASDGWVEVDFAAPSDRMKGSGLIRAGVPARTHLWKAQVFWVLDDAPATMWGNGSFVFHMV